MDALIDFIFRKKHDQAEMYVEGSEFPCIVFACHRNNELQMEFGEEVTGKTSFGKLPFKMDDYPGIIEKRKTVSAIIKNTERFLMKRENDRL